MKSYIQEQVLTTIYEVFEKRNDDGILTTKPCLRKGTKVEYRTMKRPCGEDFVVDGKIDYDNKLSYGFDFNPTRTIHLSEEERVRVVEEIYRADINAMMIHTDKIGEEHEVDKERCEAKLAELLAEYNKYHIEKNGKLMSYCKLHNLDPAKTDYEELKKIVYPPATDSICTSSASKNISIFSNGHYPIPCFENHLSVASGNCGLENY